jgi:hypothetical protein
MSTKTFQSPKFIIAAGLCLLGAGAGVWGLTRSKSETAPQVQIPNEFTVDALKKANPDDAMENFRKAMDRTDLSEEQREKIRENGREVMEQRMQDNADEWFKASKEDRAKIIDRQIDEMQKRFEKMRQEREERDAKMSEEEKEKERQKWQERMKRGDSMTQAERKSRTESRSPDSSARMMAYRQAVREQMQQKGIQPPWGRGGPGGGPGGGGPPKPPGG